MALCNQVRVGVGEPHCLFQAHRMEHTSYMEKEDKNLAAGGFVQELFLHSRFSKDINPPKRNTRNLSFVNSSSKDGLMNKDIRNPLWIVSELPASNQGTKELGQLTFHFAGSILNFPRMDNSLRLLNCSSDEPQLIKPLPTVHGMDKQIVSDLNAIIQEHVKHEKIEQGLILSSNLFNTHVKNHNVDNAHIVLGKSVDQNVVTWNKLIAGHVKQGNGLKAFNIFAEMLHEEIDPNRVTLICMLKACSSIQAIDLGRWIHVYILINGLEWALFVANTLIDMYAKCGSLEDAQRVFNRSLEQDVVSWNVLISRWPAQEVRLLFDEMQEARIKPDQVTFISMLKACSSMEDLEESWQVHCLAVESGFESDVLVGGTLIDMYAKCGKFDIAHVVFDRVPDQNVVMWSALISGYVQQGLGQEALKLFEQMQKEGIKPNPITFASILKACSSVGCLDKDCQRKTL